MNEFWANVSWRASAYFFPEGKVRPRWALAIRGLLWAGVLAYGWRFHRMSMIELTDSNGDYALHLVHLVFHEAGHVIFQFFGEVMGVLGGSLLQVLMPLIWFVAARCWGHDAFAGALCLWLMGHSLVDVSPYINDARALQMTLIGGVTGREVEGHDWEFLLTHWNALNQDVVISRSVLRVGRWIMALSLVWAAAVLVVEWRRGRGVRRENGVNS